MRSILLLITAAALAGCSGPEKAQPTPVSRPPAATRSDASTEDTVKLPNQAGPWARADKARRIAGDTIFDYMDGAGEMYLAYRFDHLDVFEYKAPVAALGTILVELYSMKTPDDAFGLLSTDWGGEVPPFEPKVRPGWPPSVPPRRALYGAGLLRAWSGDRYLRILASRETPEARDVVMRLASDVLAEAASPPPPRLAAALAPRLDAWSIRPDRTVFFRSHLVLNSAYFLASEDILGLGSDVEAVTTEYRSGTAGQRPLRVIVVAYPTSDRAHAGLTAFARAYLREAAAGGQPAASGVVQLDHGWAAWNLREPGRLTLVLDAPDRALAGRAAQSAISKVPSP